MRSVIWYQTLKNGVGMVGQNAVLTSKNALERLSKESVSLNPFAWHSNSYIRHLAIRITCTLEWYANGINRKSLNCSIRKVL